jgi:hypothetical protein
MRQVILIEENQDGNTFAVDNSAPVIEFITNNLFSLSAMNNRSAHRKNQIVDNEKIELSLSSSLNPLFSEREITFRIT